VERESVLGYKPERFSAKVREKLDEARLAQAQDLLFALHRDMRFSLSPRFELETLAAKLCWLDRWVSPQELRSAVEQARGALLSGAASGALPEGGGAARPFSSAPASKPAGARAMDSGDMLMEGFNRVLASRSQGGRGAASVPPSPEPPAAPTPDQRVQRVVEIFRGTIVKE
jgi:DNA polymerase-3 subunit gamma/tau